MTDQSQTPDLDTRLAKLGQFLVERAGEASSVRGVISAITIVAGATMSPDRLDAVVLIATSVSALLKIVLPDDLSPAVKKIIDFFSKG